METLQQTARAVTSKPVQRVVVNTVLLVGSAISLLCVAAIASALFFQNFVPDQILTTPLHLQYGSGVNPYALSPLTSPAMKAQQEYDVSVTLSMPRSPPNVQRGNFMVGIYLLDTAIDRSLEEDAVKVALGSESFGLTRTVLFQSRRPALVPFVDPIISLAQRVLFLFWHMLFPASAQTCTLRVALAERVSFSRLTGPPKSAYVEVEAGQTIQTYSAALTMTAQLSGLRYFMFHYRLPTYIAFTFLFWVFEVLFMGVAFVIFGSMTNSSPKRDELTYDKRKAIKEDEDRDHSEVSDRPHTFPTYGRQPRLKHEPEVKREDDEEEETERLMAELPIAGTEADDEDDEDVEKRDSGIGTSYSEGGGSASVRRRASKTVMD